MTKKVATRKKKRGKAVARAMRTRRRKANVHSYEVANARTYLTEQHLEL